MYVYLSLIAVRGIQRWITATIQTEVFNSLKSKLSDFSMITTRCTSIVSCWPATDTLRIPGEFE